MGFLAGRATFRRFRVDGPRPIFGEDHLDRLGDRMAGRQRLASADGVEVGWAAGGHVLDTDFTLEKNLVNDALCFDLRVDTDKLPADLFRSYCEVELKTLSANNPSGLPSAKQKREAKEAARDRLEEEAKDGRFRKRKCVPVLWDGPTNEVWFGATSEALTDRLVSLFQQTFGLEIQALTAGRIALDSPLKDQRVCETCGSDFTPLYLDTTTVDLSGREQTSRECYCEDCHHSDPEMMSTVGASDPFDDLTPAPFIPGVNPGDIAWQHDAESFDYLGNEFALWLWFTGDGETDTLKLPDGCRWRCDCEAVGGAKVRR